ncbi:MAG: tripartite tricarboxylate transporter substrate-binding protein [Acidobacteria bacterium]|nr:tripartite tricarboxylate transporter substrate-binding protein [Acidobacteriota bacterium]
MARTLRVAGLVDDVKVVNRPGDSGSLALAEFVADYRGDGRVLLVGGFVMLGAAPAGSPVASYLKSVVPIARLTGESQALAVSAASPFRTLDDLLQAVKHRPASILWVGGPYGGSNHTFLTMLADVTGAEVLRTNYVPTHSRSDMLAFVVSKLESVGLGGYGEFAAEVASGRVRVLGVTSTEREPGINLPTLREKGLDIVYVNWRGVFGAPGTTPAERQQLAGVVGAMVRHPDWRAVLREQYWTDMYEPPGEYAHFLDGALQAPRTERPVVGMPGWFGRWRGISLVAAIGVPALLLATLVVGGMWWRRQRRAGLDREQSLSTNLAEARGDAERSAVTASALLKGVGDAIDAKFEIWKLTDAEKEVALLLLKGLRHKEIADIRKTSERTVRQQSLAIYRKAGVEGRNGLAAYFLEDVIPPVEPDRTDRPS